MKPTLALTIWLFSHLYVLGAAEPPRPRLAIVSTIEAADLAALVTAKLSENTKFALVERDELARAGDERRLAQMAHTNSRALGQVLGADGLLLLSKEEGCYRVRLTAVHLGYAVFDLVFQKSVEAHIVLRKTEGEVDALASKLLLTSENAIPLSVLNLRADSTSEHAARIERMATLLLESRLSAVPEIIVLERRHAGALAFEKSLARSTPALLQGAALVDGTLMLTPSNDKIKAQVRIRTLVGEEPIVIEASGSTKDVPSLIDQLSAGIIAAVHASCAATREAAKREAKEYLLEGLWAYQRNLPKPALEALDAAELLAGPTPDLRAIRIPVLCMLAVGSVREIVPDPPMKDVAEPSRQIAWLQRAMADIAAYRDGRGETKLQFLETKGTMDGRTGVLRQMVSRSTAKMLAMLDRTDNVRAGDFRMVAREYFGFDPLKGRMPADWNTCIDFAGNLSVSQAEETAYYQKLSTTYPWAAYGAWKLQLRVLPDTFCARFIPDKNARRRAYFEYVHDLLNDPVARPAALLYLAQWAPSDQKDAACLALYAEIRKEMKELQKTGRLVYILNYAMKLEAKRNVRTAHPDLIAALHFLLQHATWTCDAMFSVWRPEMFPEDDAPALYADLKDFEKRIVAAGDGSNPMPMRWMHQKFIARFGDSDAEPLPELIVRKFWYPQDTSGRFVIGSKGICASPGGVSVLGSINAGEPQIRCYDVKLPSLDTTAIATKLRLFPMQLITSGDLLLGLCRTTDAPNGPVIIVYNRKSRQWSVHTVPSNTDEVFEAWGKFYLALRSGGGAGREGGISLFDSKDGTLTVLANSRRKPGVNQFDDRRNYVVNGIFPGPNHAACALIGNESYLISESPGAWTPLTQIGVMHNDCRVGNRTLLYGSASYKNNVAAAIMIDPLKPQPEVWLGTPALHSKRLPPKSTEPAMSPQFPSWADKPLWPGAEGAVFRVGAYGFRGDDLFGLVDKGVHGKTAELLYYRRGRPHPYRLALRFEMDAAALASVKSAVNPDVNTLDMIVNPHRHAYALNMIVTPEGICFRPPLHGFWFLPFSEIDSLLKTLPATCETAPESMPTPPASVAKSIRRDVDGQPGDEIDPANPDSFR